MRRIIIAIGTTLSGLVLLFSWPTSTNQTVASAGSAGGTTSGASTAAAGGSATTSGGSAATSGGSTTAGGATAAASTTQTFDGAAANTRYGNVQVRITVTDGVITAAEVIDAPSGGHNQQITNYAVPVLTAETISAQSAKIAMVSGATFTSRGYAESLQSALDQAGL